jgi:hypothetical protein
MTKLLRALAIAWCVPAMIGQWFFAYHIAAVYLRTALTGDISSWNESLFVGIVSGDLAGNIALVAHLVLAFVLTIGGTLQLIPQIRSRAPGFHRWNGKIFIVTAFIVSGAALYMIWTRETFGGILINDLSVSLDAVLIMVFAGAALRHARARRFDRHRRWALRTFIVASGVWFTRVIYGFLSVVPGDLPDVTADMSGPTNVAIGFASYLLPLAVLEICFLAERSTSTFARYGAAVLLLIAAAITGIGAYSTSARWLS